MRLPEHRNAGACQQQQRRRRRRRSGHIPLRLALVLVLVMLGLDCGCWMLVAAKVVAAEQSAAAAVAAEAGVNSTRSGGDDAAAATASTAGGSARSGGGGVATEAPPVHIPLVRLPSNTLLKYSAYKDVSILHFRVPADTRTALFSFKAYDESKSAFQRGCEPRDVSLHLKAGSYPVISPENITFPRHFLNADQRFEVHNLQFKSDGTTKRLSVDGPQPGNWFAVAYISWTDPNNDRIEQQGLSSSCETLLLSEMAIVQTNPVILSPTLWYNSTVHDADAGPTADTTSTPPPPPPPTQTPAAAEASTDMYKFFVPRDVNAVLVHIRVRSPACPAGLTETRCAELLIRVQANALPTADDHLQSAVVPAANESDVKLDFYPQEETWHYLEVIYLPMDEEDDEAMTVAEEDVDATFAQHNVSFTLDEPLPRGEPIHYSVRFEFVYAGQSLANEDEDEANFPADDDLSALPQRHFEYHPLLRQTYREFFMFDYDLLPDTNGTVPAYLNLTGGQTTGFRFRLGDVYDIGGTLSFAVAMRSTIGEAVRVKPGVSAGSGTIADSPASASAAAAASTAAATANVGAENDGNGGGAVAEKLVGKAAEHAAELQQLLDDSAAVDGTAGNGTDSAGANQTVIVCMRLGEPGIPTWPDRCLYGRRLLPAASVINNTNDDTSTGLIHVPFPESGEWFVTMALFCHSAAGDDVEEVGSLAAADDQMELGGARTTIIDSVKEFVRQHAGAILADTGAMHSACPCRERSVALAECVGQPDCLRRMTETETLRVKECLMDGKCTARAAEMAKLFERHHRVATEERRGRREVRSAGTLTANGNSCNASALFTISSSPCVAGRCGRFGRCYHYMSGGFVFSTCLCMKGYRGWDCSEDTQVLSGWAILLALLLLTLSNLLFVPSIYFAARRKYYTEAVIYFCAMFFSIFYHACDSGEEEYGFCLVKIGVLQFCDFYCGLLAIWVTLIAMAHVRPAMVSLLHMLGAIVLAFGTELNKQALWVFLAPALTGICIISVSWGVRCRRTRSWFPSRRYLAVFLPVGAVLVMVGLVCYAFLQTRQNYHIVHSVWHMVMALSILCLLPGRENFVPKC